MEHLEKRNKLGTLPKMFKQKLSTELFVLFLISPLRPAFQSAEFSERAESLEIKICSAVTIYSIDDCAKDCGEEFFTEMLFVL